MGTSGPYTPSTNWSGIKTDVTNALNAGPVTDQEAHDLIRDFVTKLCEEKDEGLGDLPDGFGRISPEKAEKDLRALIGHYPKLPSSPSRSTREGVGASGGKTGKSGGGSRGGDGGTRRSSSGGIGVRPVAQRLATFISQVPKVGLRQALLDAGITNVDNLLPEQIAFAITDVLATDSSFIVQTELREALATVLEKVCENPATLEAAEEKLTASAYDLQAVVQMLFECYIVERFKTFFSEHEAAKHGYDAADKIVSEAREYVASEMALEKEERHDLTAVDWASSEGAKIVDGILERTIAIYTE